MSDTVVPACPQMSLPSPSSHCSSGSRGRRFRERNNTEGQKRQRRTGVLWEALHSLKAFVQISPPNLSGPGADSLTHGRWPLQAVSAHRPTWEECGLGSPALLICAHPWLPCVIRHLFNGSESLPPAHKKQTPCRIRLARIHTQAVGVFASWC